MASDPRPAHVPDTLKIEDAKRSIIEARRRAAEEKEREKEKAADAEARRSSCEVNPVTEPGQLCWTCNKDKESFEKLGLPWVPWNERGTDVTGHPLDPRILGTMRKRNEPGTPEPIQIGQADRVKR